MPHVIQRCLLFALLLAAMTGGVPLAERAAAAEWTVETLPKAPRQGEALFIRIAGVSGQSGTVRWRDQEYPLYVEEHDLVATVPIIPDTPVGGHTLKVRLKNGTESTEQSKVIDVAKVAFPVQYLKMARKTAGQYTAPGVEEADRKVTAALRTRSERRLWQGPWALPAAGRLSTGFGVRRLRNGKAVGRHHGLDVGAPAGRAIFAPANGVVVLTGSFPKYGNTVVLDHGAGVTSFYLHMSKITVKPGDDAPKGTRLGAVGSTGASTGPHLHWGVYACGRAVQPLQFLHLDDRGVNW